MKPFDERLEWDRDGQYFHYLTKWIHALCQAAFVTGDFGMLGGRLSSERQLSKDLLARSESGEVVGIYWKMSTDSPDRSFPRLGCMTHWTASSLFGKRSTQWRSCRSMLRLTDLSSAIETLSALCQHRDWTTDDPLGLGGLLFDARRLCQLLGNEQFDDVRLLEDVIKPAAMAWPALLASRYLDRPVSYRLAFRELGLAIGLKALPIIADAMKKNDGPFESSTAPQRIVDQLCRTNRLARRSSGYGYRMRKNQDQIWKSHQDIDDVMLATALIPEMFLSVGERVPYEVTEDRQME